MYHRTTKFIVTALFWCATLVSFPEVYFSPDDNVRSKLLNLIKHEQQSIKMAVYLITDKGIVEALGEAKERGVEVEVIADVLSTDKNWGKVLLLKAYDIPVFVYDGGAQSIMHNKFFIFAKNIDDKPLLWTGSYNPTQKADRYHRENVIIEDNVMMIQLFEREFDHLKTISRQVASRRSTSAHDKAAERNRFLQWKYWELQLTELLECLNNIIW